MAQHPLFKRPVLRAQRQNTDKAHSGNRVLRRALPVGLVRDLQFRMANDLASAAKGQFGEAAVRRQHLR